MVALDVVMSDISIRSLEIEAAHFAKQSTILPLCPLLRPPNQVTVSFSCDVLSILQRPFREILLILFGIGVE